jgi:dTDP-glucose 4,6-dehydratase
MSRILITGGAGFIGSHLADRLLAAGHTVVALDNLFTGHPRNISHLAGHERFQFIKHDVTEYIYVAGQVDANKTLKVGALGTHKALGLARAHRATFLLASTSEVYGDPRVHPQPESYWGNVNPIGPRGVYDESKRFAEAMTMAYHRYHGIDTRICRIFNTNGPRMRADDGRVVTNFIAQGLRGHPLTVYDDGSRTRSFCYVSDLVEGMVRLLESREVEPVNLGNPREMTVIEFAKTVQRLTGGKSEIVFVSPKDERTKDDPHIRQPDVTRARQVLQWEPVVRLEDGLRRTIDYFRAVLGADAI